MDKQLINKLSEDWEARFKHDPMYWTSDGYENTDRYWDTGKRDIEILLKNAKTTKEQICLDFGCGIGRLSIHAQKIFKEVHGIDISDTAIEIAKKNENDKLKFQSFTENLPFSNESIDFIISFGVFGHLPVKLLIYYLYEFNRILVKSGSIRINLYIGNEFLISDKDSLDVRTYDIDKFKRILVNCGFEFNYIDEVILDYQVSDYESNCVLYVIGAEKVAEAKETYTSEIKHLIAIESSIPWNGSLPAHNMALSRAKEHIGNGDLEAAKNSLILAYKEYGSTQQYVEISELLNFKIEC